MMRRVRTNSSIPVGERINSINEWADIRNAEVIIGFLGSL
jgi:hypothetical protein